MEYFGLQNLLANLFLHWNILNISLLHWYTWFLLLSFVHQIFHIYICNQSFVFHVLDLPTYHIYATFFSSSVYIVFRCRLPQWLSLFPPCLCLKEMEILWLRRQSSYVTSPCYLLIKRWINLYFLPLWPWNIHIL